jgi:hypothetical protein
MKPLRRKMLGHFKKKKKMSHVHKARQELYINYFS